MDLLGQICLWAILLFGLLLVMLSSDSPSVRPAAEYVGSLLLIIAGLMIVAVAYDLVLLFVGLELISIPTYIVLYLGRRDAFGQEATTKYFFLSILSSALLLYGFSFLYGAAGSIGAAGSTRLDHLREALQGATTLSAGEPGITLAPIAVLLVFAGLGFRMTCVPLHFYAPDVYQGTSHANAGLLATIAENRRSVGARADCVCVDAGAGDIGLEGGAGDGSGDDDARQPRRAVADRHPPPAGLFVDRARRLYFDRHRGRAGACRTVRRRRHDRLSTAWRRRGVFLSGDVLPGDDRRFCRAEISRRPQTSKSMGSTNWPAWALASAAGDGAGRVDVQPGRGSAAGRFLGKADFVRHGALGVDESPLRPWFVGLAIIGVVNAAIAMAYYLRVVAVMYFRTSTDSAATSVKAEGGVGAWWAMVACTLMVLGFGVCPGPIIRLTDRAAHSLRQAQPIDEDATGAALPSRLSMRK